MLFCSCLLQMLNVFEMDYGASNCVNSLNSIDFVPYGLKLYNCGSPTFWHIIKRKSVEEFQPYAYIATCLNCMFWILYGLPFVHPDSILVITINSVGLAMELLYLAIFCLHDRQKKAMVGFPFPFILCMNFVAHCPHKHSL